MNQREILLEFNLEDIEKIENKVERALCFAIMAHKGQVRKCEPNKPKVLHPCAVAGIVRKYTNDPNIIAAAYLHDVVEDTKYTIEDIEKYFGVSVAKYVNIATEPDKTLSWEERKRYMIDRVKTLSYEEKLIIIADKINNIEDLERTLEEKGNIDFSKFNRGEVQQEWYFRNMYKSLLINEDPNNPLLRRLERGINNAFGRTTEEYFDGTIRQYKIKRKKSI